MDNKSDQREIDSLFHIPRVAVACLVILCVVLISVSCWLVVEVHSHHTSIAVLENSNARFTESNAKLTESITILAEEVEALKDWQIQHEKRLEKQDQHEEVRKREKRSLLPEREVQTQILTISQLLEILQGLRGPAGLPGLPGRDGIDGQNGRDGRDGEDGEDGDDGEDGEDGRDGREALNLDAFNTYIDTTIQILVDREMAKVRLAVNEIPQLAGAVYTRWGRTVCPSTSDLVMKGIAAGTHFNTQGGAAEYICLPDEPDFATASPTAYAKISGVEYQSGKFPQGSMVHQNAPCAICQTGGRLAQKMFPAKSRCPDSTWTVEYIGFLMTERTHPELTHYRTQYVCVDDSPEAIPDHSQDTNGALWYHVVANCTTGQGALGACPPYNSDSALVCIVCSK